MTGIRKEVEDFAERITRMGFHVWIARARTYGFISDDAKTRVLAFSFNDGGSLGGMYGPPSATSGTGWGMGIKPHDLTTPKQVKDALYAPVPRWAGCGHKYLTTVVQHMLMYDPSSHYTLYTLAREE